MMRGIMCAGVLLATPVAAHASKLTTLFDIPGANDGAGPTAALLKVGGKFYGTTTAGGTSNAGTVFSIDPDSGKEKILYDFTGGADGGGPAAPLIAVHGILYGTTAGGGVGVGTVFKFDPATGTETVLYTFPTAGEDGNPTAALLEYRGLLYGASQFGGSDGNGYIFSIDPATGAEATVYSFKNSFGGGNDGAYPTTAVIAGGNLLYGTTGFGGGAGRGTLYRLDPATGHEKTLHSFGANGNDGQSPNAPVIEVNGVLYGTTTEGGSSGDGTVFAYDVATRAYTVLYNFSGGNDGAVPEAGLLYQNGLLYGTTSQSPGGGGTVFAIDPSSGALTTLHAFSGLEGAAPQASLIGVNGLLYGTANEGGMTGNGTVFAITAASGEETTLHSFAGPESSNDAALIKVGGDLYGAASGGGTEGLGSIFKVNPNTGAGKTMYSFAGGNDGQAPNAALLNVGGTLYGTTTQGGSANVGTVFSFDPASRTEKVLYAFAGGNDGASPYGGLTNVGGTLFGTADTGGAANDGTVFRIDPASGAETTIYAFTGGKDGAFPYSGVVYANGLLYGTTLSGGSGNNGTVFQLDPASGAEAILYAFKGGADGSDPIAGLLYADGALYGATAGFGVKLTKGTLFKIDPATGAETILYTFRDKLEGAWGALIMVGDTLYGTTAFSAHFGDGTIFKTNATTGATRFLYKFTGGQDGGIPTAALLHLGGRLFGTTTSLVSSNAGTVFQFGK